MKHYVFLRIIPEDSAWGGCENHLLEYFSRVDYSKNSITLATTNDIFSQRFKAKGLNVTVRKLPIDVAYDRKFLLSFKKIFSFLKEINPDRIIYVQGAFTDFLLPEFLAGFFITKGNIHSLEVLGAPKPVAKKSRRYFGIFPGIGLWWYKKILPMTLRGWLCRSILSVSQEVKDRMVQWYFYPKNRIKVVYFGIDVNKFQYDKNIRKQFREKLGIPEQDQVIISTARLSQEKCIDRLINVFDKLFLDSPQYWLVITGDGPLSHELKEYAQERITARRIKFLGFQGDISPFLKMSDIYVLPSDIEGLGIALLEAMATGLVSIATKTPGPNEVLTEGINGFLAEKSEEDLLNGFKKVLMLSDQQKEVIANNARKHVMTHFDVDSKVKDALEILKLI